MKILLLCCMVCLPLRRLHINSAYGYRSHPLTGKFALHQGVDLRARHDTVFAIADGHVAAVGCDDRLGIYIRLQHDSLTSVYGHLSQVMVGTEGTVEAGEPIAITGATGRVTGEHLHFCLIYHNHFIDPIKFLYQILIQKS